jgi:serine/threonine-protein kinase
LKDHEFSYESLPETIPESIGRFTVLRQVRARGNEGQALVYEAVDPNTGEKVAVKILEDELQSFSASITAALMRDMDIEDIVSESTILSKIRHPNIVRILDTGDDAIHGPYIVMEWVDGGTLKQLIYSESDGANTPICPIRCATISVQLLEGLSSAHQYSVIHGDIKPSNILIDGSGVVKLADFGVARLTQLNYGGPFRGTLAYLAPEREGFRSPTKLSPMVDLYSVGIVMVEMLARRVPDGPSELESLIALMPTRLGKIAHKATNHLPEDRFLSAGSMINDLRGFIDSK